MGCYVGIDLHATNSVVVILDADNRPLYQKRLRNDLVLILTALEPYRTTVQGVAVESTYNPGFRSWNPRDVQKLRSTHMNSCKTTKIAFTEFNCDAVQN